MGHDIPQPARLATAVAPPPVHITLAALFTPRFRRRRPIAVKNLRPTVPPLLLFNEVYLLVDFSLSPTRGDGLTAVIAVGDVPSDVSLFRWPLSAVMVYEIKDGVALRPRPLMETGVAMGIELEATVCHGDDWMRVLGGLAGDWARRD